MLTPSAPVIALRFVLILGLSACGEPLPGSEGPGPDGSDPGVLDGGKSDAPTALLCETDPLLQGLLAAEPVRAIHVDEGEVVTYATSPPNSGSHYARWARSGVYETALEPRNWVHNLEHGWVVILHRPDAPAETIETLKSLYADPPSDAQCRSGVTRLIVTPFDGLQSDVALIAWRRTLLLDTLDRDTLAAFFSRCRALSTELAVCADGSVPL